MGDPDLFFKVTEANKGKSLSSRYLHTYSLYYLHINTSESYNETQDEVQRWVTFTYLSRSSANKGKSLSSRYLRTYNLYYEVQRWVTFTYLSRSLANKGTRLSSRYLRTNNLYYFHNNTSDP